MNSSNVIDITPILAERAEAARQAETEYRERRDRIHRRIRARLFNTAAVAAAIGTGVGAFAFASENSQGSYAREDRVVNAVESNQPTFEIDDHGIARNGTIQRYIGDLALTGNLRETPTINNLDPANPNLATGFQGDQVVFRNPIVIRDVMNLSSETEQWAGAKANNGEYYWAKVGEATTPIPPNLIVPHTAESLPDPELAVNP